jgi:hypothetical protein
MGIAIPSDEKPRLMEINGGGCFARLQKSFLKIKKMKAHRQAHFGAHW